MEEISISNVKWTLSQNIYAKYVKRTIDIAGAITGLTVTLMPSILISIAVKLDSKGPILFSQKRLGYLGKEFSMYKFRSMVVNAENTGSGVYSFKNDPRVTKVGKFIRKTSLDELPQFVNILKGDMSFIGPRPTLTYHPWKLEEYSDTQRIRFQVRPGITGRAQISGRKEIKWQERISHDIEYVQNISLTQDIEILVKTIIQVLAMKNNENIKVTK